MKGAEPLQDVALTGFPDLGGGDDRSKRGLVQSTTIAIASRSVSTDQRDSARVRMETTRRTIPDCQDASSCPGSRSSYRYRASY